MFLSLSDEGESMGQIFLCRKTCRLGKESVYLHHGLSALSSMAYLDQVLEKTRAFVEAKPKTERKSYGQFFTTGSSAQFMCSILDVDLSKKSLSVLDTGAGTGILTVALVDHLINMGYEGMIHVTCYENDPKVIPVLSDNLSRVAAGVPNFEYKIINDNFITSEPFGGFFQKEEVYDVVIGNPPYKKIAADSAEAMHMKEVCYGAPNLYFLFMAMAVQKLKGNCELVYIIPRSWTSGAYFERFRKWLFARVTIEQIHLFGSRDKVFNEESVLQETMIIKVRKTTKKPATIKMTFSNTSDFSDVTSIDVDYDTIVAKNSYVYLVTNKEEIACLDALKSLSCTLISDGLRMKTGIIVDFRTKDVLRNDATDPNTYPLLYSQHIKDGRIVWPVGKENEYICTSRMGYLQENNNYVLVKRFTAKEEPRRLQCGIYLKKDHPDYKYISTQNKVNYILCDGEDETLGVYCLLNSSIYDLYYRILNGSTQVNSTEINNMPIPDKKAIVEMGRELRNRDLTTESCDKIVNAWIN